MKHAIRSIKKLTFQKKNENAYHPNIIRMAYRPLSH